MTTSKYSTVHYITSHLQMKSFSYKLTYKSTNLQVATVLISSCFDQIKPILVWFYFVIDSLPSLLTMFTLIIAMVLSYIIFIYWNVEPTTNKRQFHWLVLFLPNKKVMIYCVLRLPMLCVSVMQYMRSSLFILSFVWTQHTNESYFTTGSPTWITELINIKPIL